MMIDGNNIIVPPPSESENTDWKWVASLCWEHNYYSEGENVGTCPECEKRSEENDHRLH
jgi:hypothetical protein